MIFTAKTRREEKKENIFFCLARKIKVFRFSWRTSRLRGGIAFIFFFLGGSIDLAFAGCPGDPKFDPHSIIHLTNRPLKPRYNHSLSTAQIESMRHVRYQNHMMHNPGLTLAEHELKSDYQMGGLQHGRRADYCVWVESLSLDFSFNKMDVYISSQYLEGSCQYKVVLGHENQHVAINQQAFQKYYALMRSALMKTKSIPTKAHPLSVKSLNQGKNIIAGRINGIVNPIYAKFKKAVLAENAKIDTIANYKRTQAQCSSW